MSVSEIDSAVAAPAITVTERAARQIARLVAKGDDDGGTMLRVAVSGGGCSGFQYAFTLDDNRGEDDLVVERDGAVVLIDEVSLAYLAGSELDYVDDLIGASFQMRNPHATASCGCGTSFSV
jgi:iron-sulfur cluster assembly accessory protein